MHTWMIQPFADVGVLLRIGL